MTEELSKKIEEIAKLIPEISKRFEAKETFTTKESVYKGMSMLPRDVGYVLTPEHHILVGLWGLRIITYDLNVLFDDMILGGRKGVTELVADVHLTLDTVHKESGEINYGIVRNFVFTETKRRPAQVNEFFHTQRILVEYSGDNQLEIMLTGEKGQIMHEERVDLSTIGSRYKGVLPKT